MILQFYAFFFFFFKYLIDNFSFFQRFEVDFN